MSTIAAVEIYPVRLPVIKGVSLKVELPSVFQTIYATQGHYLGPLARPEQSELLSAQGAQLGLGQWPEDHADHPRRGGEVEAFTMAKRRVRADRQDSRACDTI